MQITLTGQTKTFLQDPTTNISRQEDIHQPTKQLLSHIDNRQFSQYHMSFIKFSSTLYTKELLTNDEPYSETYC